MAKRDYYDVLGVQKNASDTEIKKAFRTLAKENHPDSNQGDVGAETRFKEISEAYENLKDPQTRAAYDQFGHAGTQAGGMGGGCLLYTSPSPRDRQKSRMPSSA